ncbi:MULTISPECIES: S1C family serine protease [unclassified Actinoplanes]|uniref:S1C family serine protease n=1 Tax=unclassified Actinoplanes TaxID=2626549 RepID=UPI001E5850B2|nr:MULTISPECIES: S1C family serine protease [unclassified Actinoplanes]
MLRIPGCHADTTREAVRMTATYEPFTPEPRRHRAEESWGGQYQRWEPAAPEPRWPQEHPQWPEQARYEEPRPQWQEPPRFEEPRPQWQEPPRFEAPAPAYEAVPAKPTASKARPVVIGLVVLLLLVIGWQAYRIESVIKSSNDLAAAVSSEQNHSADLQKSLTGVFDPEGISTATLPSVYRVRAGDFTGTAFSVGTKAKSGTANLLTNFHVVESVYKAGTRTVQLEQGSTRISATIVKVSETKDLALLVAKKTIKPIKVATTKVKAGQQIVVLGNPLGLDDTVTTGVISAFRENDADGPTIQFDAPINPGNSGGPVVNANRQVVALATAKARDAEGIGLGIPIATVCALFDVC